MSVHDLWVDLQLPYLEKIVLSWTSCGGSQSIPTPSFLILHVHLTPKVLIYFVVISVLPLTPTLSGGGVSCTTLTPRASKNLVDLSLDLKKQDFIREVLKGWARSRSCLISARLLWADLQISADPVR